MVKFLSLNSAQQKLVERTHRNRIVSNREIIVLTFMRIFGVAGFSGSGKTTLIEKLVEELTNNSVTVSVIKHAHHSFDIDQPGKDSFRYRCSGAKEVIISSSARWALVHEMGEDSELGLFDLLKRVSDADLVLVEGFKKEIFPKIEVCRAEAGLPVLFKGDFNILALATNYDIVTNLPVFKIDDYSGIANFILQNALICDSNTI